jgi:glycosyltransferase involved in cell wall biosynthesis
MKILHIISSGGMYGAEAVIMNLARSLNHGQNRCLLGVFSNSANPNLQLYDCAVQEHIEAHLIPCAGQIDRKVITNIRDLVQRTGADVVHAHGYKADLYGYFALRAMGIPLVSTCHNWMDEDRKVFLYGILDRMILRSYARVVAVSEDVRGRLLKSGVKADKVCLISNGIDLRPFDRASAVVRQELGWDAFQIVGLVGRLSIEKGVDIFLHAAARVLEQLPTTKFVVAGDGPEHARLDALVDSLGIRESLRLLGRRDDMPALYASLDIMVSSSRREGLPIAILEGMASRLPLVATPVGEIPSVIENGRTGMLVPVEDSESIAATVVELLQDAAKREQLGSAARQLVEDKFSSDRMAADHLRVYEEAVATKAKGSERKVSSSLPSEGKTQ